jgi:sporulation protein YlmC with PRC-barrel domain
VKKRTAPASEALASLRDMPDYDVAAGDSDPRGWLVIAADGRPAGRVTELIVDIRLGKVRYLECAVDQAWLARGDRRRVLIPVGFARMDEAASRVVVDTLELPDMLKLPAFRGLPLDEALEVEIARTFANGPGERAS